MIDNAYRPLLPDIEREWAPRARGGVANVLQEPVPQALERVMGDKEIQATTYVAVL
jgi:hypothetical protein